MKLLLSVIFVALTFVGNSFAEAIQLESGDARLTVVQKGKKQFTVVFSFKGKDYEHYQEAYPINLEIDSAIVNGYYHVVQAEQNQLLGRATVTSKNGTQFEVTDTFKVVDTPGSFLLSRSINVVKLKSGDHWFNSSFGITNKNISPLVDYDFFVPGIWYKDNRYLPSYALVSDYSHQYFYFREDRLPLPVVMWREKETGFTLSLLHKAAVPETFFGEAGHERVIDERMQFGALGIRQLDNTAMIFKFPGSEGEKTYVRGSTGRNGKSWSWRSHPVKKGVKHEYQLLIQFSLTDNYPDAVEKTWKEAYTLYNPTIHKVDMQEVHKEEIKLLNAYWANLNGAPGWPFSIYVPNGNARAYNYQMGFIGFQIPNAYYLIRGGLKTGNQELLNKGLLTIDFWANNSPTANGLPKTWADAYVDKQHDWRDYPTYMRVAGDGMEGVLHAWSIMKRHNMDKPEWLAYCEGFGNWLVENQNMDGSYFIRYDWRTGKPDHESKYTTTNVIRYLVELYYATENKEYLNAAIKAGEFSYDFIHDDYLYVGGVIDNPNVKDRESGQQAIYAFMALYDAVQDKKWLDAAVQAARYTETFMYAYNVPMAQNDTLADFPRHKETTGQTIIATGHSAVDNGVSFSSFQYYRLYLLTGDKHFLDVAKMLMYNSLQTMDLDGSLGYRYRALQTEAFTLAPPRGHSVRQWLPWNTAAVMDPLHRFLDAFGLFDIDELEKLPLEQRIRMNKEYAESLGIFKKSSK